mmetsp:Transcript_8546/g.14410  ORF Transcript_8546/g.14410 Transcript_8546/m.14410 type:complete len:104 (-) Transcript_8546:243-554(-)
MSFDSPYEPASSSGGQRPRKSKGEFGKQAGSSDKAAGVSKQKQSDTDSSSSQTSFFGNILSWIQQTIKIIVIILVLIISISYIMKAFQTYSGGDGNNRSFFSA